ncbi:MAG TPA: hypothetical protein VKH37_11365 [Ferruginibacter sp.]|nr:hypothetical protein [Ferruginibacter sp.]
MRNLLIIILLMIVWGQSKGQSNDPEFPKEFIMHLRVHNGMVTNFKHYTPDQYVGGIEIIPQYTLVVNKLRGGVVVGTFYTGKTLQADFGPTISWKLKSIHAGPMGSAANIHLNFDYLFGTQKERLLGGGINADILNWFIIGLSAHRDYNLNTWWFRNSLAVRISKLKKRKSVFD